MPGKKRKKKNFLQKYKSYIIPVSFFILILIGMLFLNTFPFTISDPQTVGYSNDPSGAGEEKTPTYTYSILSDCEEYELHYEWDYQNAHAVIDTSSLYGYDCTIHPYVDFLKVKVKCQGNYFYIYERPESESWDSMSSVMNCDSNGCYNYNSKHNAGEDYYTLTQTEGTTPRYFLICYDHYESDHGQWAWAGFSFSPREVVKKDCVAGESSCDGSNYLTCSNYQWKNNGVSVGNCGVECKTTSDCPSTQQYGNKYCYDDNVVSDIISYKCQSYSCESTISQNELINTCEYGCEGGTCLEEAPGLEFNPIYILLGLSVVVLIGVVIWYFKK